MSAPKAPPAAPKGLRAPGRRLWRSVTAAYDLEEHELALLREAVRLVDLLADLHAAVEADGAVITTVAGDLKVHPAAVEARQGRIALARVLAVLRLPEGEESEATTGRPQRRAGARGIYNLPRAGAR